MSVHFDRLFDQQVADVKCLQQIIVLIRTGFEIYDVRTFKLVESEPFDAWTLVSPVLSHTTNGTITYSDAVSEVAHSVRVYKGKIFLLVRTPSPLIL